MTRSVLAGDIGGTKTRLAVFRNENGRLTTLRDRTYVSAEYPSFSRIIHDFLFEQDAEISAACLGVAGPVRDGRCQATNLPWWLDSRDLAATSGIPMVVLLNDLEATALGMLQLPPEEFVELNPAARLSRGNIAVLAAGTGLGEALLYWDGQRYQAIATEGGHADFAPNTDEQDGLLRYLRARHGGHVSWERVVSGPGLFSIYEYLRGLGQVSESEQLAQALLGRADAGELIGRYGLEEGDVLSREALRLFAALYGAEAGNWALKTLAYGGVLLGGGIAPKILPVLREGGFLRAFCDKGRFCDMLRELSVKVALNPEVCLLGAAHRAAELAD